MRKTLFFALIVLLLLGACLPAFAAAPTVKVIDNVGYFTDAEKTGLQTTLSGSQNNVIYCVVTVTNRTNPSDSTMFNLCDCTKDDAVIALCIYHDGSEYRYYLYTFGPADKMISDSAGDRILDDSGVYNNIKGGRLAAGARAFLTVADREYTAGVEKASRHKATRVPRAIGVGLLVGAIAGGVSMLAVVLVYRKKQHGESYPLDRYAKLNLTLRQDRFIGSYVTRVRVQSNNSSRGGSFGGGHSFSGGGRGGR